MDERDHKAMNAELLSDYRQRQVMRGHYTSTDKLDKDRRVEWFAKLRKVLDGKADRDKLDELAASVNESRTVRIEIFVDAQGIGVNLVG